LLTLIRRSKTS